MMNKKAQTIIEYICVAFVFATVGIGIFLAANRAAILSARGEEGALEGTMIAEVLEGGTYEADPDDPIDPDDPDDPNNGREPVDREIPVDQEVGMIVLTIEDLESSLNTSDSRDVSIVEINRYTSADDSNPELADLDQRVISVTNFDDLKIVTTDAEGNETSLSREIAASYQPGDQVIFEVNEYSIGVTVEQGSAWGDFWNN